jgi:hypothetical protein
MLIFHDIPTSILILVWEICIDPKIMFFHGTMEHLIFLYRQIMEKMKVKIRRFFYGIRRWEYRISCGKTNALNCKPTFLGVIF